MALCPQARSHAGFALPFLACLSLAAAAVQAQHMLVDMLALGVSASAMYAAKNMKVRASKPS